MTLGSPTTNGASSIVVNEFGDLFINEWDDAGAVGQYANVGSAFPIGKWVCVVAQFTPDGKQNFYCSTFGTTYTTSTNTQIAACTYDNIHIGWQTAYNFGATTIPTVSTNVAIGEVAVWKGILGLSEVNQLFSGINPSTIRPGIQYAYYPLRTDLNDNGAQHIAFAPVNNAPVVLIDHPPVATIFRRNSATISSNSGTLFGSPKKPSVAIAASYVPLPISGYIGGSQSSDNILGSDGNPITLSDGSNLQIVDNVVFTKKLSSSITGTFLPQSETGTLSSSTKKLISNFNGMFLDSGLIAATTKKISTNITGAINLNETGTIAASIKKISTSLSGSNSYVAFVNANTKKLSTNLSASLTFAGTITALDKKTSSNLIGFVNVIGSIVASEKKPLANINAVYSNIASISTQSKKLQTSISGNLQNNVAANSKKLISNIIATYTPLAITGSVTTQIKKDLSSLSGTFFPLVLTGTITALDKKPLAVLIGRSSVFGTLVALDKKTLTSLNGSNIPSDNTGILLGQSKKINTNIIGDSTLRLPITGTIGIGFSP